MDYIDWISHQYGKEIALHAPYKGERDTTIPEEIYSILYVSNGISETMGLPGAEEKIEIGWIVYPHERILEWTAFYAANYGIKGIVFSDDGADCVYYIKANGTIACFNSMVNEETEIADTLWSFFCTLH